MHLSPQLGLPSPDSVVLRREPVAQAWISTRESLSPKAWSRVGQAERSPHVRGRCQPGNAEPSFSKSLAPCRPGWCAPPPPHPHVRGECEPGRAEPRFSKSSVPCRPGWCSPLPHVLNRQRAPLLTSSFVAVVLIINRPPLAFRGRFHLCFFPRHTMQRPLGEKACGI